MFMTVERETGSSYFRSVAMPLRSSMNLTKDGASGLGSLGPGGASAACRLLE